jgi:hypothetical protein
MGKLHRMGNYIQMGTRLIDKLIDNIYLRKIIDII